MQAAKKAVENMKETAANVSASAKCGLDKTKATIQEKSEIMNAHDPMQKEMAIEKKEERFHHAEMEKQHAREHNAEIKMSANAEHVSEGHGHVSESHQQQHQHHQQQHQHYTNAETATGYSAIGDYESRQPMATEHVAKIPELGLRHGHGLGNEVVVCSETNNGLVCTTVPNDHTGETHSESASAKF